jgi:hypothetical protein
MARNGRREAVALALARGRTVRDAAADCGVGERTVHTWLRDPDFRARVDAIRSELFTMAVGRLAELSGQAADALGGLLASPSEAVRLQAARAVLDHGPRLREHVDLARQVEELRRQMEGDSNADGTAAEPGPAPEDGGSAAGESNPGAAEGGPGAMHEPGEPDP